MKGHTLMQAIARVNRIFSNKPGGVIVDFIGIGDELKAATKRYTQGGGEGGERGRGDEAHEVRIERRCPIPEPEAGESLGRGLPGFDQHGQLTT